ncbi:hypothetical protein ACFSFY_04090 [Sporosarcina siberiensis]|uniref:Lipoprotein n=1 Tax=Sporosarcina siberiensis TaxID=1365606 RepID=A0ABW4SD13_9BACL
MRVLSVLLTIFLIPLILIGCTVSPGQNTGGFLSKKQVLKLDSNADILEYDGMVYKAGIDWVEQEKLTKGEQVGKVSEGMANNLSIDAKIYVSKERGDILIVKDDGEEKMYLLQVGE